MPRELTIVVPAFNEEARLETTVNEILEEAARVLDAFEVVIVNDGSRDGTGNLADRLASWHPNVSVIHHAVNQGVGSAYWEGLQRARYPYLTLIPGDNAFHRSALRAVFSAVGCADLVVSYRSNMRARPPLRRLLSVCCTLGMRWLTGCPIRDAHSAYVFPVEQARRVHVHLGYGYHIEALSALLQRCRSYVEVPALLNPKPDASSGVMKPRVIATLVLTLARAYWRRFTQRTALRGPARPVVLVEASLSWPAGPWSVGPEGEPLTERGEAKASAGFTSV